MYVERLRSDWSRTSSILAMLYNVNRDLKTSPKTANDFNPFARREDDCMTITKDEAKTLFGIIAQHARRG